MQCIIDWKQEKGKGASQGQPSEMVTHITSKLRVVINTRVTLLHLYILCVLEDNSVIQSVITYATRNQHSKRYFFFKVSNH